MTKAGKRKARAAPTAGKAEPDDQPLFGQIVKAYLSASKEVWNDPSVWIEERDSDDRRVLAWPHRVEGTGYEQLLAILFNSEVDAVLSALELHEHPALPAFPHDVHDPRFQVVLRVLHRAFLKGKAAIDAFEEAAGSDRVTGLREFRNDFVVDLVAWIQRSKLRRELGDHAFDVFGISRSVAYRAMRRRR